MVDNNPNDPHRNIFNYQITNNYMEFIRVSNEHISNIIDIISSQQMVYYRILLAREIINPPSYFSNQNQEQRANNFTDNFNQNIFSAMYDTLHRNDTTNQNYNYHRANRNNNNNINFYSHRIPIFRTQINMNNVDVPTNNVNNVGTTLLYRDIENPGNDTCPICQVEFSPDQEVFITNYCRHIFDNQSMQRWMSRNHYCPLCRYDFNSEDEPTLESNSDSQNNNSNNLSERIREPLTQHLANFLMEHMANDPDFAGNINIDLNIPRRNQ